MGFGGISIWQLLIVLAIVILIFGTKRLKGLGGDVGGAIKSFKKAVNEDEDKAENKTEEDKTDSSTQKASLEQKDAEFAEAKESSKAKDETRKATDKSAP